MIKIFLKTPWMLDDLGLKLYGVSFYFFNVRGLLVLSNIYLVLFIEGRIVFSV